MSHTEITVNDNGPIKVSGTEILIKDSKGNVFDLGGREVISLCRCGASANKPFCDGSHRDCAFDSQVKAFALPPKK